MVQIRVARGLSNLFVQCMKNLEAGQDLLRCIQSYDRASTDVRSLRLELRADDPFRMPSAALLATGLELLWENRKFEKVTAVNLS